MKKTIYLNKDYSIENIDEIAELIKQNDYEFIDYSNCEVDSYVMIILDNFNNKILISNYGVEKSYLLVIYNVVCSFFIYLFNLILFSKILFKSCDQKFQKKYFYNDVLANIYDMALGSIGVIIIFSVAFGVNLAVETVFQLRTFSSMEIYTMNIVIMSLFKGMGLFITLIVLSSKYASGLIAKVGFMKITDEWNALKLMNIDPEIFLLKSKIIAFMFLVPFCSYISIIFATIGGYCALFFYLETNYKLFISVLDMNIFLFFAPLFKGILIGACLGIIASYEAYCIKYSSDDILKALSRGIVSCIILCHIVDIMLTLFFRRYIL